MPIVISPEKSLVSASLMCCDPLRLGEEIARLAAAGVDLFHVDVMDGCFVPNYAMNAMQTAAIHAAFPVPLDVHLMVHNPDPYLELFARAGAAIVAVHIESCPEPAATLRRIRELGMLASLAISPATPLKHVRPLAGLLDLLLVMTVVPGFAGQNIIPEADTRVKEARAILADCGRERLPIAVDGHISPETGRRLRTAGASVFVAGTAGLFYGDMDYAAHLRILRAALQD